MQDVLKHISPVQIAITGPESTGKSQLARDLALHFGGGFVDEYAREYLRSLARPYTYDDLLQIARHQFRSMGSGLKNTKRPYLFYDTELTVLRIWCEFKYGKCHPWILEHQQKQSFSLYLLTDTDLPWQPDPLREHPDKRKVLFDLYRKELEKQGWDFEIVSGLGRARLEHAIRIIESRY